MTASGSSSSAMAPSAASTAAPPRHVALLAHDVRLRLEEVAARVEGDGLADEREPRPLRRAGGLVAQDDEPRRLRARAAHGGERGQAGGDRIEHLDAQTPGARAARSARPAGVTTFGGPSTSSRATFVQRATSSARAAIAALLRVRAPQTTKRSTPASGRAALPAARVVAAEDRALDDRLHLAVHRPSAACRRAPTRPCRRRGARAPPGPPPSAGPPGSSPSSRDQGDAARAQLAADLHHRHRIGVGRRAHQPPLEAARRAPRTPRPPAASARTSASTSAGSAAVSSTFIAPSGIGVCMTGRSSPVSIIARCAFGSSAPPPAAASRSGTATARPARPPAREPPRGRGRSRRSRSAARTARGSWPTPRRTCASSSRGSPPERANGVRAAPVAGVLLTDAEIDHTAGLLLLRESSTAIRVYGSDAGPPRADRRLSRAADPRRLLRRRVADARARRRARARRLLARGRVVRGGRRRAALPRRDRRRGRGRPGWSSATARPAAC